MPLLILLVLTCVATAQSKSESDAPNGYLGANSETYSDTLRVLEAYVKTADPHEMAHLFSIGSGGSADLLRACGGRDRDATAALHALQFLGILDCSGCADSVWHKHTGVGFSCAANLTDKDFEQIDKWLAKTTTPSGYDCGSMDRPRRDEPLVYALILNASSRSEAVLSRMLAVERACSGTNTAAGRPLEQSQSLIAEAKRVGRNLTLLPDVESAIRNSAFFISPKDRENSGVEVLARTEDRILADVGYSCGPFCSKQYYVVLRRDGAVWQYALIVLARYT